MKQIFRYGVIGVTSNAIGYLLFLLITYWGVEAKQAMSFLYLLSAVIGFVGNNKWTFSYQGGFFSSGVKYFIAHLTGYLINFFILYIFVDKLAYSYQWVQAIAIIFVAGFLFMVFKYFVFVKVKRPIGDDR